MKKALVLTMLLSLAATTFGAGPKPNVVFILTDDMGYGDLGCYGGTRVPTPSLDGLAREGLRFTQYTSASPVCSPSRTGLTTGMFPARWRITNFLQTRAGNRECEQADFLDPAAPSLARALKAAGYATAHIGKWHMGGGRDVTNAPPIRAYGFDEAVSTWESPEPHPDITAKDWIWSPQDKVKRWDRTAFFVDKALDFLKRHRDQPCYVNLWPDDTHSPYKPGENRLREHGGDAFAAVLAEYDRQMGRFLAGIRELGLDEKTIVIFTSDNGAEPGSLPARNGGLRGFKFCLYEGGLRMPFIVRWPGRVPAGRADETTLLSAVDLLPTVCALAGAPLPAGAALDGEDMSRALLGEPVKRTRPLFWEFGRNGRSFRYPEGRGRSPALAVREVRWKLLVNADGTGTELYDLESDRGEATNVADAHGEVAERLRKMALDWRRSWPQSDGRAP